MHYPDAGPIEGLSLLAVQRVHIYRVLLVCRGNRMDAARVLRIGHRTLYNWIEDLRGCGLEIPRLTTAGRKKGRGAQRHLEMAS